MSNCACCEPSSRKPVPTEVALAALTQLGEWRQWASAKGASRDGLDQFGATIDTVRRAVADLAELRGHCAHHGCCK